MKKYKQHLESDRQGFTEADIKPKFDYNQKMIDEGITIDTIFEEVPVRIHNSALVNAMLYDWACEGTMGSKMHLDFERLDLTNKPFLEKSMELLMDGIENLRNVRPAASPPRAPVPAPPRAPGSATAHAPHGAMQINFWWH